MNERVTILIYAFIRATLNKKGAPKRGTVLLGQIMSQRKVGMGGKHQKYRFRMMQKFSNRRINCK